MRVDFVGWKRKSIPLLSFVGAMGMPHEIGKEVRVDGAVTSPLARLQTPGSHHHMGASSNIVARALELARLARHLVPMIVPLPSYIGFISALELTPIHFNRSCPMSKIISVQYECTQQTFRPWPNASVRWLDWEQDYGLAQCMWPHSAPLTLGAWHDARRENFTYCAVVAGQEILSMAAVWKYCETAWEVAAVGTRPAMRRHAYGKAVVSFVTAYILAAARLATCSTAGDNLAMQRTAESVGFCLVRRSLVDLVETAG